MMKVTLSSFRDESQRKWKRTKREKTSTKISCLKLNEGAKPRPKPATDCPLFFFASHLGPVVLPSTIQSRYWKLLWPKNKRVKHWKCQNSHGSKLTFLSCSLGTAGKAGLQQEHGLTRATPRAFAFRERLRKTECLIENSVLATCILFFEEGRNQVGESQGFLS